LTTRGLSLCLKEATGVAKGLSQNETVGRSMDDPFSLYKPSTQLYGTQSGRLFDFCKQDSAKLAVGYMLPAWRSLPTYNCPVPCWIVQLQNIFARQQIDRIRSIDPSISCIAFGCQIRGISKSIKDLLKLTFETSRLLASNEASLAELLKVNSSTVSLLY
jgi:hypothetical protein